MEARIKAFKAPDTSWNHSCAASRGTQGAERALRRRRGSGRVARSCRRMIVSVASSGPLCRPLHCQAPLQLCLRSERHTHPPLIKTTSPNQAACWPSFLVTHSSVYFATGAVWQDGSEGTGAQQVGHSCLLAVCAPSAGKRLPPRMRGARRCCERTTLAGWSNTRDFARTGRASAASQARIEGVGGEQMGPGARQRRPAGQRPRARCVGKGSASVAACG